MIPIYSHHKITQRKWRDFAGVLFFMLINIFHPDWCIHAWGTQKMNNLLWLIGLCLFLILGHTCSVFTWQLQYDCLTIVYLSCVFSKYPSTSEDLPNAFYLREAGSGRQGSPESAQAERHGRTHFTKGSLPFYWAGFIKTASFWQFNWKSTAESVFPLTAVTP